MKGSTPALLPPENIMFLLSGGHSIKAPLETEQTPDPVQMDWDSDAHTSY